MEKKLPKTNGWGTALLVLLPVVCILVSLTLGAYRVSVPHVFRILWGKLVTGVIPADIKPLEVSMVFDVRLPRVLGAVMVGAGLSVSGGVFQALFGNPLADPYTLGVSNGAGFGAALAIVLSVSSVFIQLTSFI